MRCIVIVLFVMMFAGCRHEKREFPVVNTLEATGSNVSSLDVLNRQLDSLTALGECCLVRGSDREYDTIIDHVRYRYVKDEGCDTPVDKNKYLYIMKDRKEEE